jgi:hypothetical protein
MAWGKQYDIDEETRKVQSSNENRVIIITALSVTVFLPLLAYTFAEFGWVVGIIVTGLTILIIPSLFAYWRVGKVECNIHCECERCRIGDYCGCKYQRHKDCNHYELRGW